MKLELSKREIKAMLACIIITEDSIDNNVLMVRLIDKKALKNTDLDDLYVKIHKSME